MMFLRPHEFDITTKPRSIKKIEDDAKHEIFAISESGENVVLCQENHERFYKNSDTMVSVRNLERTC